eukprot:Gregarina_sp_Poly_1__7385@NODE_4089_length_737_cov_15_305970_g2673_i0_p1_GENE_NODE_4089_length_737_cov_15_305970_g2673_i0NODE_4089_length_737_cov_15_305970_g2673_i0_p1_ORF_typecomplete_len142_score22_75_NODE_4089_length_737_cov_15_305970_g2673_i0154579
MYVENASRRSRGKTNFYTFGADQILNVDERPTKGCCEYWDILNLLENSCSPAFVSSRCQQVGVQLAKARNATVVSTRDSFCGIHNVRGDLRLDSQQNGDLFLLNEGKVTGTVDSGRVTIISVNGTTKMTICGATQAAVLLT